MNRSIDRLKFLLPSAVFQSVNFKSVSHIECEWEGGERKVGEEGGRGGGGRDGTGGGVDGRDGVEERRLWMDIGELKVEVWVVWPGA